MAHPICSECGLPWKTHGVRVDEAPLSTCVRLLRAEVYRLGVTAGGSGTGESKPESGPVSKDRVRDLIGQGHPIREVVQS